MAVSRYSKNKQIIDEKTNKPRLETFNAIKSSELIDNRNDIFIEYTDGMRLDKIAFDFFGDGRYWWVICLVNDLLLPFGGKLKPGFQLRIPRDISKILNIVENKQV